VTGIVEGNGNEEQVFSTPLSLRLTAAEFTLMAAGFPKTVRHLGKAASAQQWLYIRTR
jgi:hypothetical protein